MVKIRAEERHAFAPSRPDGTVCVAERHWTDVEGRPAGWDDEPAGAEVCGYPAGHPIHGSAERLGAEVVARRNALRAELQHLVALGRDNRTGDAAILIEEIVNR